MGKKTIVFVLSAVFFLLVISLSERLSLAALDCLTLTSSSSKADKDYCRNELAQIEAQLADLLAKQAEQQKKTGTLKGDVEYLQSQINALKTKIKARALVISQLQVDIE